MFGQLALALFCLSSLCLSTVQAKAEVPQLSLGEEPKTQPPRFLASHELGVSQCVLKGEDTDESVVLRVFLSACMDGDLTMKVAGFAFLEGYWHHQYLWLSQSAAWTGTYSFKSAMTGKEHGVDQYQFRWLNTPTKFFATLPMDEPHEEFFFHASGFNRSCRISALSLTPPSHQEPAQCIGRRGAPIKPAVEPSVYFAVSPFFGLKAQHQATLLLWHMKWHKALGVDKYMLYSTEQLPGLVNDDRLKEVVNNGSLQIIDWTDVANQWPHPPYSHQILIYNHAVLAHWNEAAYVILADVDEYLATPSQITIQQVIDTCGLPGSNPNNMAVFEVDVHLGLCDNCHTLEPYVDVRGNTSVLIRGHAAIWLNDSADARHPMSYYNKFGKQHEAFKSKRHPKVIVWPNAASYVVVHWVGARKGYHAVQADSSCAKWLHIRQQLSNRRVDKSVPMDQSEMDLADLLRWLEMQDPMPSNWLWPLEVT